MARSWCAMGGCAMGGLTASWQAKKSAAVPEAVTEQALKASEPKEAAQVKASEGVLGPETPADVVVVEPAPKARKLKEAAQVETSAEVPVVEQAPKACEALGVADEDAGRARPGSSAEPSNPISASLFSFSFVASDRLARRHPGRFASSAQQSRELTPAAAQDPVEWPGTSLLVLPDMQLVRSLASRPSQSVAAVGSGDTCSKCKLEIRGVVCWEHGKKVHFGCATDATQDAIAAGTNTQECLLGTAFSAWRGTLRQAQGDVFKQFRFDCRFAPYLQHLEVSQAFALSSPDLEKRFESAKQALFAEDPCVLRLYHGTSHAAAREICAKGFKLPTKAGMFGQGLYFTDVPAKSMRYAPSGFVLVCDVAVGRTMRLARGVASLRKAPDGYDSVTGLMREQGGTLRAPEYVVYNPSQVMPRYMLVLQTPGLQRPA